MMEKKIKNWAQKYKTGKYNKIYIFIPNIYTYKCLRHAQKFGNLIIKYFFVSFSIFFFY